MLPFDNRPWAKPVARLVIVLSIAAVVVGLMYIHSQGPIDTGEIWVAALFLFAVLPPNIAILFRKQDQIETRKQPLRVAH